MPQGRHRRPRIVCAVSESAFPSKNILDHRTPDRHLHHSGNSPGSRGAYDSSDSTEQPDVASGPLSVSLLFPPGPAFLRGTLTTRGTPPMRKRSRILALAFALPLTLAACSGGDEEAPATSTSHTSTSHTTTSHTTSSSAPASHSEEHHGEEHHESTAPQHQEPAPQHGQHQQQPPASTAPQAPAGGGTGHDDDPGGHPCTDDNGAPGHYIRDANDTQWICEITGDAPRH